MAHRNTNILTILILLGLVAGALVGEYGLHDPTGANVDQLQWLKEVGNIVLLRPCPLYTPDPADDTPGLSSGGRRTLQ